MAKIRQSNLDETIVTGLTELSENRADGDFALIFDASSGTLKKIQASNLGLVGPKITSVSPTNALSGDGTGNHTFTITGLNFATGTTAKLINTSGTDVAFDTLTRDSSTQLTGVIAKSSLTNSAEPYDVSVTSGQVTVTLTDQINVDASPTFNTASGSLGTIDDADRATTTLTVEAFDPESAGNVTFELQSGSLPAGATATTVHENGVSKYQISGFSEVGSDTTSSFTLRAVDAASNTTSRSFSITVNTPVAQTFTSSGTFSVPSGVTAVDVLVVGGGGGGGSSIGGGGGAGGLVYAACYPVTPGGTVSVTVGEGGTFTTPTGAGNRANNGQSSVFGTITAQGGGGGGNRKCGNWLQYPGADGASGGGGSSADSGSPSTGGSATQGPSGGYTGYGNNGGGGRIRFPHGSGGGGGAGAGAGPAEPSPSGRSDGGVGRAYTIADGTTPVYYAGGGAGVSCASDVFGGQGGGGDATYGSLVEPGEANKGGGGAGGTPSGAPGGKGVVIVRWG